MILWFGKKKNKDEALQAGAEMESPDLSAEALAALHAADAEATRLAEEEAARKAEEQAEIERKVAEANRAWEERQKREAAEAEAEAARLAQEAEAREAARQKAEAEAEAARQRAEADAAARSQADISSRSSLIDSLTLIDCAIESLAFAAAREMRSNPRLYPPVLSCWQIT